MQDYMNSTIQVKKETKNFEIEIDTKKLEETIKGGLKTLCTVVGWEVMQQLFSAETDELCGPKGKHDKERKAYRHGSDQTKVVYGGEKRCVQTPRVRAKDGSGEIPLETLAFFQDEDRLTDAIFSTMINGVSTRKYARTLDSDGIQSKSISKSSVSAHFRKGLEKTAQEFFKRPLESEYVALMIDGVHVGKMVVVVAMGITFDGHKHILGLKSGGTENHVVVEGLFNNLVERGLDPDYPRLYVIDGGKGLHKAIKNTFGKDAVVQRCQVHKKRNVLEYLPESSKADIGLRISMAYLEFSYDAAKKQLLQICTELERSYPDAASSLLEGLEETLTVHRLQVPGLLRKTLATTNPIESGNAVARTISGRTKNWRDGDMILKHMAAAYLSAEESFRRVNGYKQIPFLINALSSAYCSSVITTA